ncbi:MAG: hypothetical protein JWP87_1929 [Labilithrix sp.]|jgi:hypothetical protein|nr:hypothetical protein [Labilithrix sp.]
MLKRLIIGLILGVVIGGVVAAVLVQGLGWVSGFPYPVFAYLAAAATGVITGLVAGKPIWAADGKIEAGLKAFFGALLGLGAMFALRSWANVHLDLSMLKAGEGELGNLPAAALPIIAAVLAGFYELDNSPSTDADKKDDAGSASSSKKGAGKKVRVADEDESVEDEEADEPVSAKKKGH